MNYLLDTNVISEFARGRPDPNLLNWMQRADENRLYLSVLSIGEIVLGIESLARGKRRSQLQHWLEGDLRQRFAGRLLDVDREVAETWGSLMAAARAAGATDSSIDWLIAATALHHGMTIATRDTSNFAKLNLPLVNPWLAGAPAR